MKPERKGGQRSGQSMRGGVSWREQYRLIVSLLIIPLGLLICLRALLAGWQAWSLLALGLAFVALGIVRLRAHRRWLADQRAQGSAWGKTGVDQ